MKRFITLSLSFVLAISAFESYSRNKLPLGLFPAKNSNDIKMLSSFLFTAGGNIADGNRVVFDALYSNAVDANDAIKILNPGENFGLLRDNNMLSVEARQPLAPGDTLFYNLTNLVSQVYRLEIVAQNLGTAFTNCELIDRYLNTRKNISLTDSNHLTLEITADPASRAPNRLTIVFSNAVSNNIPVRFTGITATRTDKSIVLLWQVEHEVNVEHYEIERSADAEHFTSIFSAAPIYENENGGIYQYNDISLSNGNFYRIKSIDKNGIPVYSDKVRVPIAVISTSIMNVYPNPVINSSFCLQLNNMTPGKYYIKLSNSFGQPVYTGSVNISGDHFTQTISLDAKMSKGDYNVSVGGGNGIVGTTKLIVQ